MRKINALSAVVVASTIALGGCGGDDDGSPAIALTAITTANAAQVSSVVYGAASVLFNVASSSGTLPVGAVVSDVPARPGSGLGLASFAARQLKAMTIRPLPSASGVVGVVYEDTYQCAGGGTVTERIDDADNNGVDSVGDSSSLSFVNCVEEGLTANGVVSLKWTLVSAASNGAQVTFDKFVLNDGMDVIRANGGFSLIVTENAGVSEVYEVAGDNLTSSLNGDEYMLTGFTGSAATDLALGTVTYAFKGGVSDSSSNIAVNAETVSAFVARLADAYPGRGTLRSTGAGNSQALLEVLSSTLVRISADPEGDGSFTAPVEWSWSALEALPSWWGDGDSSPAVALTAITAANAAQVSSVVYQAASVLFDVASSSGTLPVGAVVSEVPALPGSGLGLASFAARQLKAVTSRPLPAATGVVGVVYEETYPCAGGGTVTDRIDDADNNGVESIGDSVTLTYVNCVEEGLTANGVVSFKLTLVSAASNGADVTFGNFVLNDGTDVIGANGGFNLILTENAGVSEVYQIAGDKLTSSLNGDEHSVTGFTGSATTDLALGTVTYTFKGGVSDSSNGIAVNAETLSAFVARLADDYPGSGTLRSTGAGNSQAWLEVLSPTLVRISADPEGDGSFTAPVVWSWSDLEALPS